MQPLTVEFVGGDAGEWQVASISEVRGEGLPAAARMSVLEGPNAAGYASAAAWVLRGVTSNERYVQRAEQEALRARTPALGRPEATAAATPAARRPAIFTMPVVTSPRASARR